MGNSSAEPVSRFVRYGEHFINIRADFKVFKVVQIGTHMSIVRLSSGRYLLIDTVPIDEGLRAEIDALTNNGELIEGVVATHPFHTIAFPGFRQAYPEVPFYGTPRHLRVQPDLNWAGNIQDHLARWEPDVYMRIPAGAEFVQPMPEKSNHFSAVWVFSPAAHMLHVDDTIMYLEAVPLLLKMLFKSQHFLFHPSIKGPGLYPTPEAPFQFRDWVRDIIRDWDFDSVVCAHRDVRIGGAKALLQTALEDAAPLFESISAKNAARAASAPPTSSTSSTPDSSSSTSSSLSSSSSPSSSSASSSAPSCQRKNDDDDDDDEVARFNVKGVECG